MVPPWQKWYPNNTRQWVNLPTVQNSMEAWLLGRTVSNLTEYPTLLPSISALSLATLSATLTALIRLGCYINNGTLSITDLFGSITNRIMSLALHAQRKKFCSFNHYDWPVWLWYNILHHDMSQYNHPICTEEPAITVINMLSQWSSVHAEKCQGNYRNQMA